MNVRDAAWGVLTVLATNCVSAMRTISVERGYDPREFTLMPFGGMGPTIACLIARELGIRRILVPRDPGTFSAWGMLVTDVHQENSLTRLTSLEDATPEAIDSIFAALEKEAVEELVIERFPRETIKTLRYAGMRYRGQSYEVHDPAQDRSAAAPTSTLSRALPRRAQAPLRPHGGERSRRDRQLQGCRRRTHRQADAPAAPVTERRAPCADGAAQAWFGPDGECYAPVWRRNQLAPGMTLKVPAIVEEKTSTIVIYPGQSARIDGVSQHRD